MLWEGCFWAGGSARPPAAPPPYHLRGCPPAPTALRPVSPTEKGRHRPPGDTGRRRLPAAAADVSVAARVGPAGVVGNVGEGGCCRRRPIPFRGARARPAWRRRLFGTATVLPATPLADAGAALSVRAEVPGAGAVVAVALAGCGAAAVAVDGEAAAEGGPAVTIDDEPAMMRKRLISRKLSRKLTRQLTPGSAIMKTIKSCIHLNWNGVEKNSCTSIFVCTRGNASPCGMSGTVMQPSRCATSVAAMQPNVRGGGDVGALVGCPRRPWLRSSARSPPSARFRLCRPRPGWDGEGRRRERRRGNPRGELSPPCSRRCRSGGGELSTLMPVGTTAAATLASRRGDDRFCTPSRPPPVSRRAGLVWRAAAWRPSRAGCP